MKLPQYPSHDITFKDQMFEFWQGTYYQKVATLNAGNSFGELALIEKNKRRTATVITETDVAFVTLDSEQYLKSYAKIE